MDPYDDFDGQYKHHEIVRHRVADACTDGMGGPPGGPMGGPPGMGPPGIANTDPREWLWSDSHSHRHGSLWRR
jgi:hypothetical protein